MSTPPTSLAPDNFAARLYGMLDPLADADATTGWSLLLLCSTVGLPFELVEDWVRDQDVDVPGWSLLLDVNRCPPEALGWLAQFVGVRLLPGDTTAASRTRIASTAGFRRGTAAALTSAAAATLTGNRSVLLTERSGVQTDVPNYAYHLTVQTYAGQTPDQALTQRALLAQKPGGLVLTYICVVGQVYDQVRTRFATYAALKAGYPSYQAVWTDTPP